MGVATRWARLFDSGVGHKDSRLLSDRMGVRHPPVLAKTCNPLQRKDLRSAGQPLLT